MKKVNIWKIAFPIAVTSAFAAASALLTDAVSEWYLNLTKPAIQPPLAVFFIASSVLCVLFAASFALVLLKNDGKGSFVFLLNLFLQALWRVVFFKSRSIGGALIVLIVIFICAVYLAAFAYKKNLAAGILITPYVVWCAYALAVNYAVALLN